MATAHERLIAFLEESNRIESIFHVKPGEIEAAEKFLAAPILTVADIEAYVRATAPHAELRDRLGLNVQVGRYVAPAGSPRIRTLLCKILDMVNDDTIDSYDAHIEYEALHPFTDGNGRSGRLLWLWHRQRGAGGSDPLGFLHRWYYQSLEHAR